MYNRPSHIDLIFHTNGGYSFYTAIKYYGSVEVESGHKFMTKGDALTWCDREYPEVEISII